MRKTIGIIGLFVVAIGLVAAVAAKQNEPKDCQEEIERIRASLGEFWTTEGMQPVGDKGVGIVYANAGHTEFVELLLVTDTKGLTFAPGVYVHEIGTCKAPNGATLQEYVLTRSELPQASK